MVPICTCGGFCASSCAPSATSGLVSQGLLNNPSWAACWGHSSPNLALHLPLVKPNSGSLPKEATNVCFGASFSTILKHPGTMNCSHKPTSRACHKHPFFLLLTTTSQALHTPPNNYQLRTPWNTSSQVTFLGKACTGPLQTPGLTFKASLPYTSIWAFCIHRTG